MKSYKDFEKQFIGRTSTASLILVGCNEAGNVKTIPLRLKGNGSHHAYIVDEEIKIESGYEKKEEFVSWMKIYDDKKLVKRFQGDKIVVYGNDDMEYIIQITNMSEYAGWRSELQQIIYDAIVDYITQNGYAPSIREISSEVCLTVSSVHEYLHELELMGKIEMKPNSPRAIRVIGYEYRKIGADENGK